MSLFRTWYVAPDEDGWLVERGGSVDDFVSRHGSRDEALREATHLALESRPSQVVVYSPCETITQCVIYDTAEARDLAGDIPIEDTASRQLRAV